MGYIRQSPDKIPICSEDLDWGTCGKPILNIFITKDGSLALNINNYARGGKPWQRLCKISFCPMCGRELPSEPKQTQKEVIDDD
jgi:hypothetical protein